jgi:hypothetical protein
VLTHCGVRSPPVRLKITSGGTEPFRTASNFFIHTHFYTYMAANLF